MAPLSDLSAVVGIDIGGTTIKGAAFGQAGSVLERATVPTFGTGGSPLDATVALISQLAATVHASGRRLSGIGVASPGLVDSVRGAVTFAANLGWNDLAIVDELTDRFGVPVVLEHDARAAAHAERAARLAAGRDGDEFIFVPIGTGIAAAIVTGGHLVTGVTGGAGEFGHVPVVPGGEACTCGSFGCVEVYASASSIVRRYRAAGGTLPGGTREITEAIADDPIAASVWRDAVDALATGIKALSALLDPTAIVIGGGLGEAGDRLLVPLRERVAEILPWRVPPRIEQSLVGAGAGLIGAGLLLDPASLSYSTPSLPKELS